MRWLTFFVLLTLASCGSVSTFNEDSARFERHRAGFDKVMRLMRRCPDNTWVDAEKPDPGQCGPVSTAEIAADLDELGVLWVSILSRAAPNGTSQAVVIFVTGSAGLALEGESSSIRHYSSPLAAVGVPLDRSDAPQWVYCYMDTRQGGSDCQLTPYSGG